MLSKYKGNGDNEFATVYFNSATKTVINSDKYGYDRSFQEILCRIDNWINQVSGWIIESIEAQYVNISVYTPLSGRTYIELPYKLKNPTKSLINIKKYNNERFLWCHIRHLNSLKIHPERITKVDKRLINYLDYEGITFPVSKKVIEKIEKKNNIWINVFCYEGNLTYPVYVSDQKFENCMDLLLTKIISKILTDLCVIKQKIKIKKYFCKCCLQFFSSEKILIKNKENCLIING